MFFSTQSENFSSNPGKLHFDGFLHLLRYIRDNKNLGLKYRSKIEDAPLSDLLIQAIIKTENQFMVFFGSIWQYCPDTGRSTETYIVFYQGEPIDHFTHVPVPVNQSSADIEYNTVCTLGIALLHFRMINNELLNKDPDMVP